MDRSGLAALNGDILRRRGHIAVHRDLRYQVGAGEQPFLDLPVFPGGDSLIDFIPQNVRAGNIERNPGHNAVLAGLNNLSRAIGFRLDLHKEGNRVAGAGHHGLVAGPSPDQHIVCNRNILSEFKGHRIHNHVLTGKGILVPAS